MIFNGAFSTDRQLNILFPSESYEFTQPSAFERQKSVSIAIDNWHGKVILPEGTSMAIIRGNTFDGEVTLPESSTNASGMFSGCQSFNHPVTIPDSVTNCQGMFMLCRSLNSEVKISNNAVNC